VFDISIGSSRRRPSSHPAGIPSLPSVHVAWQSLAAVLALGAADRVGI